MIAWIIYIIVAFILLFVLYIAMQGIDRGVKAKNTNKLNLNSAHTIGKAMVDLNKLKIDLNGKSQKC